jgi:hypothetical protein
VVFTDFTLRGVFTVNFLSAEVVGKFCRLNADVRSAVRNIKTSGEL